MEYWPTSSIKSDCSKPNVINFDSNSKYEISCSKIRFRLWFDNWLFPITFSKTASG